MNIQQIHIAIRRADGSVSIMAFLIVGRGNKLPAGAAWMNDGSGWWVRDPTDEVIAAEVGRACTDDVNGPALGWRILKAGEVPVDRTYRDAWVDTGTAIVHDMAKAKEIQRDRLRKQRAVEFDRLDGEWMRATGQGLVAEAAEIEAQRQVLRDITDDQRIDAAVTVADLAVVTTTDVLAEVATVASVKA